MELFLGNFHGAKISVSYSFRHQMSNFYRKIQEQVNGNRIYCSKNFYELPKKDIEQLDRKVLATCAGPSENLQSFLTDLDIKDSENLSSETSTATAYGISTSLYERDKERGGNAGDPVADTFAVFARKNSAVLAIADGVSWGPKSKLSSETAVESSFEYLNDQLFSSTSCNPLTTHDIFKFILNAFNEAQKRVIEREATLTTLCVAVVTQIKGREDFVACVVSLGDSLAYVYNKKYGVREITQGNRNLLSSRDIKDSGGALGPVHGFDPDLRNLTFSFTVVAPGDVVFLTTDGVSDNFDPVVAGKAVPKKASVSKQVKTKINYSSDYLLPEMDPFKRHQESLKTMETVFSSSSSAVPTCGSAVSVCDELIKYVTIETDGKRSALEDYKEIVSSRGFELLDSVEKKLKERELVKTIKETGGKLDHASVTAYQVGVGAQTTCKNGEITNANDWKSDDAYQNAIFTH